MRIIVDGKEAVLKAGSSFEYISENPLFTEAEGYSLEIEFPLEDCPENILIFGALHVKGVDISTVSFPCELDAGTFRKTGILTITSVTEVEVKGQFLEGMSEQNYHADLGSTYITDLDFSQWDGTSGGWENYPDGDYAKGRTVGWIEFPVYDTTKQRVIRPVTPGDGRDYYSRHVYLWKLVDYVAAASGWSVNQSVLKRLPMYMHVVVVNSRNFIYNDSGDQVRPLALSLPHWTIEEFYKQISYFFGCLVNIDLQTHSVTYKAFTDVTKNAAKVELNVLDDFEIEVSSGEDAKYRGNRSFKLPDDANPGNINSCAFIVNDPRIPHQQMTKAAFLAMVADNAAHSNNQRSTGMRYLYELTDTGQIAMIVESDDSVKKQWILVGDTATTRHYEEVEVEYPTIMYQHAEILNQYGDVPTDGEELKICPCPMEGPFEDFRWGQLATVPPIPVYKRKRIPSMAVPEYDPDDCYDTDVPEYGPNAVELLSAGERKDEDMYFDKLWVVLWQDQSDVAGGLELWYTRKVEPIFETKKAEAWGNGWHEFVDDDGNAIYGDYTTSFFTFSWHLQPTDTSVKVNSELPVVDETQLYRYKFLSNTIPDPKAIFVIKGQNYACERITAHFTQSGMSELLEGEFYRIID